MKVLIVAKTQQHPGACIGAISADGRSLRLVADGDPDHIAGLDYSVGDVWEVDTAAPAAIVPPHVENVVVRSRTRLRTVSDPVPTIEKYMAPSFGPITGLYGALVQRSESGGLYIAEATGVPAYSTLFWRTEQPMERDTSGKRLHYCCPGPNGACRITFVGFQEPASVLSPGTLLRISLAHWWRPADRPEQELRCYVQLSGWFDEPLATHRTVSVPASTCAPAAVPPPSPDIQAAQETMKRVFGFNSFRPLQEEIVTQVLARRDTLAILPTGSGKSLCFQLPSLLFTGLTVVVSPLIALMEDQVEQLRAVGVPAVFLNSTLTHSQYVATADRVRRGEVRLLYAAPETLLRPEVLVLLDECRVDCLTIDEAHCISEWGHDFRPEYRRLLEARRRLPDAVCLALTATATPRVQADIHAILGISEEDTLIASFDRPNLYLSVVPRGDGIEQIASFLADHPNQAGIVYCSTREQVDTVAAELCARGHSALPYHAGLDDATRRKNQRQFSLDEALIMVATIAFGMGINKSNVRFVLHYSVPDCLETYYQQIGRAGRDGLRADCLLLFARSDLGTIRHFIDKGAESERAGRSARLQAMARFAEMTGCRRHAILRYFGEVPAAEPCGMCDNCLAAPDRLLADVGDDARLFLRCVRLTRERFGIAHVVDVLRGSHSQRVGKWRHDRLDSHGAGRHRTAVWWRRLADQLLEQQILEQELEHATLRLTPASEPVLAGGPVLAAMTDPVALHTPDSIPAYDTRLFEELRRLRKQLADEAGLPPFVVFSDRSLAEMAAYAPRTEAELLRIHGVGEHKLGAFGAKFLTLIREYAGQHGLHVAGSARTAGARARQVAALFNEGAGIPDLEARLGITRATIIGHLEDFRQSGGSLDSRRILGASQLPASEHDGILRLFETLGTRRLGPVSEALEGRVPYVELHLLRLAFRLNRPDPPHASAHARASDPLKSFWEEGS